MITYQFDGRCAIVTGGASGIGWEIARSLSESGAMILLNDINSLLVEEAAHKLETKGARVITVSGDAADEGIIDLLVSTALRAFGKVDFTIANAGMTTYGSFLEYEPAQFRQLIDLNLFGSFFLAQRAARSMISQSQGGKIIFMSSVTGHQAHPNLSAYGMTKAALEMLAKQLAIELSPYQINVNAIAPGATSTPRTQSLSQDYIETWERLTPLGRVSSPLDIAQCALFLLSDAARQITGQTIIVDGGWTSVSPPP